MTTIVIIKAHCSPEKEVKLVVRDDLTREDFTLQDGETAERYIYNAREISVREVTK